jgi:hypothetical protein
VTDPGPAGNKRLTTSVGLILIVLLAVEALTTLSLRSYLSEHIFLGLLLLPPLALKLTSAGWRFLHYYARDARYRLAGPPPLPLRLLAPLLVAATIALFGSGVALIVVGHGGGWLQSLHATSFVVWGALIVVHVLAYVGRSLRDGTADWRPRVAPVVAGARARRGLLVAALALGVIVAVAASSAQDFHRRGGGDRAEGSTVRGVGLTGASQGHHAKP